MADRKAWTRRALVRSALAAGSHLTQAGAAGAAESFAGLPPGVTPAPPGERRVGIGYALWHRDDRWDQAPDPHKPWGRPELGYYRSDDAAVLSRHAEWLTGAGVDFVILDWSNDLGMDVRQGSGAAMQRFIEQATITLFDAWSARPSAPHVVLMIGNPGQTEAVSNGQLAAKASEVHDLFVANPARARLLQTYHGKPLLLVYVGTPSPWPNSLPPWREERFMVRFVTGFLSSQKTLLATGGVSRFGYWSWEDRREPTYAVFEGYPENMTAVAAWRGRGSPGRAHGQTYRAQWARVRQIGPRFALAGTFNEWWRSEQEDPASSKDVEPSREHGWQYLDLLKEQATLFKEGK